MTTTLTDAEPALWHRHLNRWRQTKFESMGWTGTDWLGLYTEFADTDQDWGIREWLTNYASRSEVRVTPDEVRAAHTAHGDLAVDALKAMALGASERFVTAFIRYAAGGDMTAAGYPDTGWEMAVQLGLNEPEATGWAITGQLGAHNSRRGPRQIREWTTLCGPGAWLWVLAGFTIVEALTMPAGSRPGNQQLRVMAALNGTILPAGL